MNRCQGGFLVEGRGYFSSDETAFKDIATLTKGADKKSRCRKEEF